MKKSMYKNIFCGDDICFKVIIIFFYVNFVIISFD